MIEVYVPAGIREVPCCLEGKWKRASLKRQERRSRKMYDGIIPSMVRSQKLSRLHYTHSRIWICSGNLLEPSCVGNTLFSIVVLRQ